MIKKFENAVNTDIYGKHPLYPVRDVSTIREMFDSSTELFEQNTAFLVKDKLGAPYREIKYAQLRKDVYALATALIKHGLKDHKIAVIGENRYEWAITYLAVVCGVGTIVPLDKELPAEEVQNLLDRAKVSCLVFSKKIRKRDPEIFERLGDTLPICMDDGEDELTLSKLIAEGQQLLDQGDHSFADTTVAPEDVNIILFTSGTTGLAKGVMLSQKNIASNLMNMCSLCEITESTRFFSVLPLHHTYECTCGFLCPLYRGASIAYCEGLKYMVKNMKEAHPSYFLGVPLIVESIYRQIWKTIEKKGMAKKVKMGLKLSNALLKVGIDIRHQLFQEIHDTLGGKMYMFVTGAAAIDPQVSKGFREFGINVIQGYGLTECSPIAAVNRDVYFEDASVGLPPPEVAAKILNPDKDGIGEILIKGDNVMVGYYEDPEKTKEVLIDGWLHTGDLGYIKKGFIYITGRAKDVIVTANGKNVFPEEVETYLCRSPYIAECMVYGNVDKLGNETMVAAHIFPNFDEVKQKLGINYTQQALHDLIAGEIKSVNQKMPSYKSVQDFDIRQEEFIKTTTKKIKRFAN